MRQTVIILLVFVFLLGSCKKEEINSTSGIATINNDLEFDNELQNWYVFGFLFSEAAWYERLLAKPSQISQSITMGLPII
jgi:hypothetical protein